MDGVMVHDAFWAPFVLFGLRSFREWFVLIANRFMNTSSAMGGSEKACFCFDAQPSPGEMWLDKVFPVHLLAPTSWQCPTSIKCILSAISVTNLYPSSQSVPLRLQGAQCLHATMVFTRMG